MGRPERPLDPTAGLLQAFAHELRALRRSAGNPKYRALARTAGYSASSLSAAASGYAVPSLAVVLAYAVACGGDRDEWERRWRELAAKLATERAVKRAATGGPPANPAASAVPRQLPMDVPGFVGRDEELAELDALLAAAARGPSAVVISTVAGTGGVGKTALAVRWAHRVADRFPDGQLYVNLRGYDPDQPVRPADALSAVLRGLGVNGTALPYGVDERAALYRSLVADRRLLVLLDNAHTAAQVRPLLPGSASCFVLVTSRDSLAGLSVRDGARRVDLDRLPLPDAVTLLGSRIGDRVRAQPHGATTLAARCARLPLALRIAAELAAGRPSATLTELADDLADQGLDVLCVPDERSAVRAVFSWSYRHLPEPAAAAFRLVGLHPGRDLDGYALAALAGRELGGSRRLLDVLVNAHLIEATADGRYTMHDLLRAYAAEQARTDPEPVRHAALTRLFDHYLAGAVAAMDALFPYDRHRRPRLAPPPDPPPDPRAWLDAERANLVAVIAHAARHGWPAHATGLAATIAPYLEVAGHHGEAYRVHSDALDAARATGDLAGEAHARHHLGTLYYRRGRRADATAQFERALEIRHRLGDRTGVALELNGLAVDNTECGRLDEALRQHTEVLAIRREIGDRAGEGVTLGNIGSVYWRMRKLDEAYDHNRRALAIHRDMGHRVGVAYTLTALGACSSALGRYPEAMAQHREALSVFAGIGYLGGEGYVLDEIGVTCRRMGRFAESADHHRRALAVHQRVGYRLGQAETLDNLGALYRAWGRYTEAEEYHRQAVALAREIGNQFVAAHALTGLGEALAELGRTDEALDCHRSALALAGALGDRHQEECSRARLAALAALDA